MVGGLLNPPATPPWDELPPSFPPSLRYAIWAAFPTFLFHAAAFPRSPKEAAVGLEHA